VGLRRKRTANIQTLNVPAARLPPEKVVVA
jgi:hypothetical protein